MLVVIIALLVLLLLVLATLVLVAWPLDKIVRATLEAQFFCIFGLSLFLLLLRMATLAWSPEEGRFKWPSLHYHLSNRINIPSWDFTNSWASSITTAGTILGTVLAAQLSFPPHAAISQQDYIALSLFYAAVAVLAALFYNATRASVSTGAKGVANAGDYQGYIWTFLVAGWLTLGAAWSEMYTLHLLLIDIAGSHASFPGTFMWILDGLLLASVVLMGFYAWRTIEGTIYWAEEEKPTTMKQRQARAPLEHPQAAANTPAEGGAAELASSGVLKHTDPPARPKAL